MDSKRAVIYEFLAKRPDICQSLRLHLQAQKGHNGGPGPTVDVARTLEVLQDTGMLTDVQQQLATYMQSAERMVEADASEHTRKEVKRREGSALDCQLQDICRNAATPASPESGYGPLEATSSSVLTQEVQSSWLPEQAGPNVPPYLLCRFSDGHGFSEYADPARHTGSYFVIHVSFGSQRFRSRPVEVHKLVKLQGVGAREGLSIGKLDMELQLLPRDEAKQLGFVEVDSQLRRGEQENSSYGLDSPFHCARFVAAIETERRGTASVLLSGECGNDVWCSWPALLARGVGTVEDHAMLLCSLLLGFSMDAWVALEDLPYCWVVTRDQCGDPKNATFWDACTGQRLASFDPAIAVRFASVHCVFNHKAFYACCSVIHAADKLHYHFEDDTSMWWKMPEDVFNSPLLKVEENIRHMVDNYRRLKLDGLDTQWDDAMSIALSMALANYETERTIGVTFGDRAFRDIVKGLSKAYIFKACPLHFHTGDVSVYFGALLSNTVGRHILDLPLGPVKCVYGVRCKIFKLPEDQVSVWVILAVRHDPCY
ncbi:cDNA FLJ60938, highly similar to Centrosomal protein of 76 kDa, related [Neospora caninum Liverpool]|uniref:cDNA FLJ60938, highly similar to Centrosomal protein of 76 kDa, related n=1 Tax=Neospora caninum (strain Liverpool) TaxID=572307 RepID=F0VLS6_NEOCL|nr:cDNA FLJ60938, highly similar to Centrosomal protein of 76 kDa, related [Neospora caninum Liverpool]CBZ54204.1 cDNA FLJ60938, highly similar to Centrosomal protein of 76 kDa, related [Neospora caninum Liverpool]|eukprot:XP_003884235.1 cDNA FLJ60938, highly similar to Centrosomal protein of 76 kDa, related [Neospora caninum Liverpool]